MLIEVVHRTTFSYDAPVVESTMEARLGPLTDSSQRVLNYELTVDPVTPLFSYRDGYANQIYLCTVLAPHSALTLEARTTVETLLHDPFATPEASPGPLGAVDSWPFLQFRGPVERTPEVVEMAAEFASVDPSNPFKHLLDLMHSIHASFEYEASVTTVSSTVADVIRLKKGVCQDFAHVMIAACRAMGCPARYVSGYILTSAESEARGGDASHAWCEVYLPEVGWRGFDPTNDVVASERHVKVGIGKDYTDVPPTRGIHRGLSDEHISVSVTTRRIDGSSNAN